MLLILAGITISQLKGNGILGKVKEAKEKHLIAKQDEENTLNQYLNNINIATTRDDNIVLTAKQYQELLDKVNNCIQGNMIKLNKEDINSTSWTKMELNDDIDNYKLLEFVNSDGLNTIIYTPQYFKENYNSTSNFLTVACYINSHNRSAYFYYNSSEKAIYAKHEHTAYICKLYGIK